MKILLTGLAGTGKTTVLSELQKHGYAVIDLDATGICRWRDKDTQEITEYGPKGRDYEWLTQHGWYCDIDKLKQLLSTIRDDKDVFVAAIAENIEELVVQFNRVFVLIASDNVIKERLNSRTNNHFAKKEDEQNFVLEHSKELLRKIKDFKEVDATRNPSQVAGDLLKAL